MPEVLILPDNRRIKVEPGTPIVKLLESIGIRNPEDAAVVVNNKLIEDTRYVIRENDRIRIIFQGIGG